jgi:hypothetical protein
VGVDREEVSYLARARARREGAAADGAGGDLVGGGWEKQNRDVWFGRKKNGDFFTKG